MLHEAIAASHLDDKNDLPLFLTDDFRIYCMKVRGGFPKRSGSPASLRTVWLGCGVVSIHVSRMWVLACGCACIGVTELWSSVHRPLGHIGAPVGGLNSYWVSSFVQVVLTCTTLHRYCHATNAFATIGPSAPTRTLVRKLSAATLGVLCTQALRA